MKRIRVRVYYSGRVQGVGFRYTVKSLVPGFEICGTVRNMLDGRVELVAEGSRAELEAFLSAIRDSGVGRFVRREAIEWLEAAGDLRGFQITG
jgi:acylphosphatase